MQIDGRTIWASGAQALVFSLAVCVAAAAPISAGEKPTGPGRALMLAVEGGDLAGAVRLIDDGVDFGFQREDGNSLLHLAIIGGHYAVAAMLIAKGAPPDLQANDGRTPIILAAMAGHRQTVELLLEKGARLDASDRAGRTALHWAGYCARPWLIELLLESGKKDIINVADAKGMTPLHLAVRFGKCPPVNGVDESDLAPDVSASTEVLVKAGAKINALDGNKATPLHWAAFVDRREVVPFLLYEGADATARQLDGRTPLQVAKRRGSAAVARQLSAAQKTAKEYEVRLFNVRLLASCSKGDPKEAARLLNKGAEIMTVDEGRRTPLHLAAANGQARTANLLIKRGAVVNAVDGEGKTPLDLAAEGGHAKTARLLKKHGGKTGAETP